MTEHPGLREQKKRQTRLAIARAAHQLAATRPYADITVAEIAAAAGVSRRTISNYYSSKAECFSGLVGERLIIDIASELIAAPAGGARDRLAAAFKNVGQQFWDDSAAMHRLSAAEPEVAAVVALAEKHQCAVLVDHVARSSGGRLDPFHLSVTVAAIGACISACVDKWFATDCAGGTKALADLVAGSLGIFDLSWLDPHVELIRGYLADSYPEIAIH